MGLFGLINKVEALVSIDIGSTTIKLVEMDLAGSKPKVRNLKVAPVQGDVFNNYSISKIEKVAEQVGALLEEAMVSDRRVITAVPGPSVFTKKIKMPKMDLDELAENIQFEANNFIPHNVGAVKLDFHIIGETGKNQLDILVVAVKNEIIDSLINTFSLAGLETAVVDVDYFALQNCFELTYPELLSKTVALINIGARYSCINICKNGNSLFTGDVSLGGKLFSENISQGLGVSLDEAEGFKRGNIAHEAIKEALKDIIDQNTEHVASELNRQLSFFWNASGADEGIDKIILCGGGALVPGLVQEISEKTGVECALMDPLKGVEIADGIDRNYAQQMAPHLAVGIGLGLRQTGDKIVPEYLD